MADTPKDQDAEQAGDADMVIGPDGITAGSGGKSGLLVWLAMAAGVIAVCSAAGFLTGKFTSRASGSDNVTVQAAEPEPEPESSPPNEFVYYDLEPITVNLDEPRLARYVRATIKLAVEPADWKTTEVLLEKRKPELRSWLTVYLAGRTLDEVRGNKSINRIRREITDAFNEQLWPKRKPRIHHILLEEFVIQ